MTKMKRGLGKGLGALIPDEIKNSVAPNVSIEEIKELCKDRINLVNWAEGWSEVIED